MDDWRTCPECRLRYRERGDGVCPRCRRSAADAAPSPDALPPTSLPSARQQPPAARAAGRPPRVWPVFLTLGLVFLALQVAGLLLLLTALHREGLTLIGATPRQMVRVVTQPYTIIGSSLLSGLLLLATAGVAAGIPGVDLRLRTSRLSGFRVLVIVVGGLAAAVFVDALVGLLAKSLPVFSVLLVMKRAFAGISGGTLAAALLIIGLLTALAEEAFFRGLVQTRLSARWGPWVGVLVTAAAFGFYHGDLIQGPFAFLLGLYLGWMTEVAGSIVPAIVVHVLNNTASVITMAYGMSYGQGAGILLLIVCGSAVALIIERVGGREPDAPTEGLAAPSAKAPPSAPAEGSSPRPPVRILSGELEARRLQLSSVGVPHETARKGPRIGLTTPSEVDAAAELRFVVRRLELTPAGLRITGRRADVRDIPWAETQTLVVRRLPADQPWNGQLLVDIVVGALGQREVVRLVGTTPIAFAGPTSRPSTSRLENVRSLAAHLAAQNPNLVLDPETAAFAQSGAPAGRFLSMTDFTVYDASYG